MMVDIFKMKLDSRFMLEHMCYDEEEVTLVQALIPRVRWSFGFLALFSHLSRETLIRKLSFLGIFPNLVDWYIAVHLGKRCHFRSKKGWVFMPKTMATKVSYTV